MKGFVMHASTKGLSTTSSQSFSAKEVIANILGADLLAQSFKDAKVGQYVLLVESDPVFRPPYVGKTDHWMAELGIEAQSSPACICLPNMVSTKASDFAYAAHEAYHAWLHSRSRGVIYKNEKVVNRQAAKWLKRNLQGMKLLAALEVIVLSNASYGVN